VTGNSSERIGSFGSSCATCHHAIGEHREFEDGIRWRDGIGRCNHEGCACLGNSCGSCGRSRHSRAKIACYCEANADLPDFLKLPEVVEMLERARKSRSTCDDCERFTYAEAVNSGWNIDALPAGCEDEQSRYGIVRRCSSCAEAPRFPWIDRLDAEHVLRWMLDRHNRGEWSAFSVDELQVLL